MPIEKAKFHRYVHLKLDSFKKQISYTFIISYTVDLFLFMTTPNNKFNNS